MCMYTFTQCILSAIRFNDEHIYLFFVCMFYQLLHVHHSCSSTQSWGIEYYHLLLRRETRIPGVAPFSFRIGIWDFVYA